MDQGLSPSAGNDILQETTAAIPSGAGARAGAHAGAGAELQIRGTAAGADSAALVLSISTCNFCSVNDARCHRAGQMEHSRRFNEGLGIHSSPHHS